MLIFGDSLGLLHEHRSIALMLELVGVPRVDWHYRTIHMELSNQRTVFAELWPESMDAALAQS
jgi:hypothetical protein